MQSVHNRRGMVTFGAALLALAAVMVMLAAAPARPAMSATPAMPAAGPAAGSTDFRKALAANSDQAGSQHDPGVVLRSVLEADGLEIHSLGGRGAARARGLRIIFFGTGDANDAMGFKLWIARDMAPRGPNQSPTSLMLELYGYGTATLGTQTGLNDDTEVTSVELFADTIAWTVAGSATATKGVGDMIETAYGALSSAYSPADNTVASLCVPDLGNAGYWILEFDRGGDANLRMNALVADEN